MKKTPSADYTPAATLRKSTGLNCSRQKDRAIETIKVNVGDLGDNTSQFILTRAAEWRCTPAEAVMRLLDERAGQRQEPSGDRRLVTIEIEGGLLDEVSQLLKHPEGIAVFGNAPIEQHFSGGAERWMRSVTFAMPQGSGYRRAVGSVPTPKIPAGKPV